MPLTIGIVGLPNVGKSTLFNALTRAGALAANYPFATVEPNVGVVPVPDPRLDRLAGLFQSARVVPAAVTFVDIAGLVRGAHQGQGLGNRFLAHIREADAICQVVRVFSDADVAHVDGRIDPAADVATVNTELVLADLQTVDGRLERLARQARMRPDLRGEVSVLEEARRLLDQGNAITATALSDDPVLRDLHLLTGKPFVYVFNVDDTSLADAALVDRLARLVAPSPAVACSARLEEELAELPADEAAELSAEYGQAESGLTRLARAGFAALGLQTFLTAGPKEARAWTIRRGATAPEAAGVIHSDFQRGFIRAEVVSYDELAAAGSLAAARARGKLRSEGRDYVMREGDVVEFRFNV